MRPWLSRSESFSYRIVCILREVMVGLIIRFASLKENIMVLPIIFGSARSWGGVLGVHIF